MRFEVDFSGLGGRESLPDSDEPGEPDSPGTVGPGRGVVDMDVGRRGVVAPGFRVDCERLSPDPALLAPPFPVGFTNDVTLIRLIIAARSRSAVDVGVSAMVA
jgi:hypothetical protein